MAKKRASITDNNPLETNQRTDKQRSKRSRNSVVRDKLQHSTFLLHKDQVEWLETICFHASKKGGKKMSKAYVIRALIDAAKENNLDLAGVRSEDEVKVRVSELFDA